MRHRLLGLTCGLGLCPAALLAQRPLALGLAGGVSIPQGGLRNGTATGWHAVGALVLSTPKQPLGLRLDAAYASFAFDDRAGVASGGAQTIGSATLNATYRLPMTDTPLSPYVITGLGAYRTGCASTASCEASTRFGWNAGVGTRFYLRGITTFVEARYHRATRDGRGVPYIPVTLGLLL